MLIENLFGSLFKSANFFSVVFPNMEERYLTEKPHEITYKKIVEYYEKFSKQPSISDIKLMIDTDASISEIDTNATNEFINSLKGIESVSNEELLIKEVEKYFQSRALENAILDSVEIIQSEKENNGQIEEMVKNALGVCFDIQVGHDYFNDAAERLKWYNDNEEVIPFDIELLNAAMGGGLRRKGIGVFMAPPKRGKSLFLAHCAASLVKSGQNVLYLTCELSEKMISKRIDANLLDIPMNELNPTLNKNTFKNKFKSLFQKTHGELVVKEYASGTLTSTKVRSLLRELKGKKDFVPDVILIDYINICASSTLPAALASNTNLYIGRIVIEMRAIAQDMNMAILSAVQNNRGSVKKTTDTGMDDLADAFSIAMNVDWGGTIIQTDELREARKFLLKTVLTRWDENANDIFTIGVDYGKMRLLNLDDSEQEVPAHIKDQLRIAEENAKAKEDSATLYAGFEF